MDKLKDSTANTGKMPVLFLGHGSPMNAIEENEFVMGWRNVAETIPKPYSILCISAHWETIGTFITAAEKPLTIHDFGGFPGELYDVQYPANGNSSLAIEIKERIGKSAANLDFIRGLDHGCWCVLKHMYPDADIPVIQLSLDYNKDARQHYELAGSLNFLREKEVLIIGSGNMVHNLSLVAWDKLNDYYGYEWAKDASNKMKEFILKGEYDRLIDYKKQGGAFDLAIPSPDHFLPLLYVLALKENKDKITIFNDKPVGGSLTMTSIKIG
jgi:4,5-DOPA dioxygenase extradiol